MHMLRVAVRDYSRRLPSGSSRIAGRNGRTNAAVLLLVLQRICSKMFSFCATATRPAHRPRRSMMKHDFGNFTVAAENSGLKRICAAWTAHRQIHGSAFWNVSETSRTTCDVAGGAVPQQAAGLRVVAT
jgi:hypothetical protein